jgi:transposase
MFNYSDYKIFLACGKTDMRKSINGLSEIVLHSFELDPRENFIFAFCNSQKNRIKLLVWEDNGFWVHFKRIEKGRVIWPEAYDDKNTMNLSLEEFKNILGAPGVRQKIKRREAWRKC